MEVSFRQLYDASRQCRRGKTKGFQCQRFEAKLLDNLFATQAALQFNSWQPQPMRCFIATNGSKPREIHAPAYADRVVHHWLIPRLQALIEPKFIHDCAANIKGRGTHFAVQRLQQMFRRVGPQAHYLQLDIHNFFYSISRPILLNLLADHLRRAVRDHKINRQQASNYYNLCCQCMILPAVKPVGDSHSHRLPPHKQLQQAASHCGLPIGNLTSQFFSNVYLNPLDQFVKHQLKCQYYVRYVDDFILVHQSAEQLRCWQRSIEAFLQQQLQLQLKPQTILRPLNAGADFLGYIVRPHYRLVRRRVLANWRSKLKQWRAGVANGHGLYRLPPQRLAQLQSVCASYLGHIQHASYFSLLDKLLAQMPWLQHFYSLNQGKLIPRWQNRKLYRFVVQCRWFLTHYPQYEVWVQKGRHFINARQPDREYPLLQLHQQLRADRSAARPYAWISEQGYIHRRLKHRQLAQLFWPQDQIIHSQ
jgi:hypothetical protein